MNVREQVLQRQNDRLDDFAEVISHDLRNALNVATGNLALADEECDSEYLTNAATALDRMDDFIEDPTNEPDYETIRTAIES